MFVVTVEFRSAPEHTGDFLTALRENARRGYHEVRTPHTSIIGALDLLLGGASGELNERQRQYLTMVRTSVGKLNALVDPDVIRALYPDLFAVHVEEFDYAAVEYAYGLPAETEMVLEVRHRHPVSYRDWETSRHWDVKFSADTTDFPTGVAVEVYTGHITPGARVQVVYATRPTLLTNLSDEFAETTGLNASAKDLVLLGVAARLAPYMDASRLPVQSVEADLRGIRELRVDDDQHRGERSARPRRSGEQQGRERDQPLHRGSPSCAWWAGLVQTDAVAGVAPMPSWAMSPAAS